MQFLLDTNAVSDFVRGEPAVVARLKSTSPELLAVSTVTLMEIEYGLKLDPARARKLAPLIRDLVDSMHMLPFTPADASAAAGVRAALHRRGRPIGPYDVLLAGCALSRGLIFVTANTAELARVSGLRVENWRQI